MLSKLANRYPNQKEGNDARRYSLENYIETNQ